MPTPGKIETFHKKLIASVKNVIGWDIEISPCCPEWKAVKPTAQILWTSSPQGATPIQWAYRDQGMRVYVFSVAPWDDEIDCAPRGWVTWSEKWVKQIKNEFELMSAGWTAFWGPPYDDRKAPVLRADWDQPIFYQLRGQESEDGQPHWHIDRVIPLQDLGIEIPTMSGIEGELEPIISQDQLSPSRKVSALRMGKVHLAMGTWNELAQHPKCWRRDYEGNCDKLLNWAEKSLLYLKGQLGSERDRVHFEPVPSEM